MPKTTFDPMTVSAVVAAAGVEPVQLPLVPTEVALVRLSPIERLVVPLMQINDARVIASLCI